MRILILANNDIGLYKFRKELLERLISDGHTVYASLPEGDMIPDIERLGCEVIKTEISRHGTNPVQDLKLLQNYKGLIKEKKPDIVFTYTIKPNLYGALAAAHYKIPIVANITGLGTAVENSGLLSKGLLMFYKYAFRKIQTVYVQNEENKCVFEKNNIAKDRIKLLPGSGVNLEYYQPLDYPDDDTVEFVFISRIMKEKGIEQFLETAEYIRKKYPQTRFHICGFCEEEYEDRLHRLEKSGVITYHGLVMDIREVLSFTHCTIHPSFYPEGISNVLLESSASGRPIITTDRSGCREVIDDGVNGYMIPQRDTKALINAVEKFLSLSNEERRKMGLAGRKKVEKEFDRKIVVEAYMNELKK